MKLRVLSLGAGVQSSCLLLMSIRGELPKLDGAIFADTQWEPSHVYKHLWWLAEEATRVGIPVYMASKGNLKDDMLVSTVRGRLDEETRWVSLPLYTKADGGELEGRIRRQCTREYKLDVVERVIREEMLGIPRNKHVPKGVEIEQWIGISWDEKRRMRVAEKRYVTNEYPLIGWPVQYLNEPWTRKDCQRWFGKYYPNRALLRSSCIGCPMHSNSEWVEMKKERPEEWREAVEFDEAIRNCGGKRGETFVHRSCKPLAEAPIESLDDGQMSFSCMGMCDT